MDKVSVLTVNFTLHLWTMQHGFCTYSPAQLKPFPSSIKNLDTLSINTTYVTISNQRRLPSILIGFDWTVTWL